MNLQLVNKNGEAVMRGDKAVDFRGEEHIVTGWQEPRHSGSTGRVRVKRSGERYENEFYPSVFDMAWVNVEDKTEVLIDSQFGIYIPQMFAKTYDEDRRWVGADDADLNTLTSGPDNPEYWEAWERVDSSARYHDKDGREWKLWLEGDLFAYTGNGEQWT